MSATSTHDTKRSEDVRARLCALSELPREWRGCLERWGEMNEVHRVTVDEEPAPDPNDEYFIYQTLLGAWPVEPYGEEEYAEFIRRIQAYLEKAFHEAKVHTSWINPSPEYDEAVRQFTARILDPSVSGGFLDDFRAFGRRLSRYGFLNSLAQCLLKITAPGVPDLYQGTELWDFSLVDPDNRRPVDYERRRRLLGDLLERAADPANRSRLAGELAASMGDGRIKLYVTTLALRHRRDNPQLFSTGEYLPVAPSGPRAEHLFAFVRRAGGQTALVAVPRLVAKLVGRAAGLPHGLAVWGETMLPLPEGVGVPRWRHLFTGATLAAVEQAGRPVLPAARVFEACPVALLLEEGPSRARGAAE
jgi:(1->4)-alpha-D-glucan 1-alpha-D-glucosylmutase